MCALAAGEVRPAALGQVRQRRVRRGDRGIERVEITALVGHAHDRLPKVQCDQPSSDGSGPKIGVRRRCRRITQDTHPASSTGIDTQCRHRARGRPGAAAPPGHERQAGRSNAALAAIKVIHTLAWFSVESCMAYVLYAGFARQSDRRVAMAAGVVAGESLIFVANRCRCPLTQLVEWLGTERGSVTDIYLPGWFAHNLPAIHAPLIVLAVFLYARNSASRDARDWRSGCLGKHSANPTLVSGIHHGGAWRGGWPAGLLDPQPMVEGSYAGWLGPHQSAQTCAEQHKRLRAPQPAARRLTNLVGSPCHVGRARRGDRRHTGLAGAVHTSQAKLSRAIHW